MQLATESVPVSKKVLWTGRILSALPALMLIFSASMKFVMPPGATKGFADLGWPEHYASRLGIVELTCAIVYLIPQTSVLGAILVTGYLGGAIATHARLGDPAFFAPLILGVVAWLGLFLRE